MHDVETTTLPKKYHEAVCRWRDTYLPDYQLLVENWDRFFPRDPAFRLCAYRQCGMCGVVEVGENEGKPKFERAGEMTADQAAHLLKAVRAQASTEFGSIQQHQLTLSRAQSEQDQFWILRMMAEELRHGYQMFHVLLTDDWEKVSPHSGEEMVEEILSMRTGSHVLGAFNVDFDSFVDSIVFCAIIDRVGKYQLSMQKISSYRPMAESMPPMLQEEAFHLAAGVVPLRRWVKEAATTDSNIGLDLIRKTLNKWFPRGLDMFGDERGGGTNVRYGFKPMKNAEAIDQYADEVRVLVRDLNIRFVRARAPEIGREQAERIVDEGEVAHGIQPEELLTIPDVKFFRRRGVHAYQPFDVHGNLLPNVHALKKHLEEVLPGTYPAGRDFKGYLDLMRQIEAGELTPAQAVPKLPNLSRVGGVCPCSRAVRWILDNGHGSGGNGG